MVRVSAAQTGLRGPITASEQVDEFSAEPEGRWGLSRSNVHQTYEGASMRTPIHRLLIIDRHEVNPPDFAERRAAAYASQDVILRDTPEGFRYLKKEEELAKSPAAFADAYAKLSGMTPEVAVQASKIIKLGEVISPDQIKRQAKGFAELGVIQKDVSGEIDAHWDGSFIDKALGK